MRPRGGRTALVVLAALGGVSAVPAQRTDQVELLPKPANDNLADSGQWKSNFHAWKGKGGDAARSGYSPIHSGPQNLERAKTWTHSWRRQRLLLLALLLGRAASSSSISTSSVMTSVVSANSFKACRSSWA